MNLKVYEIAYDETLTVDGTVAAQLISYDVVFSDQGPQGIQGIQGIQGPTGTSALTNRGDILYRNATVPDRLAIGTAGQFLTVNTGATAPEWATITKSTVGLSNVDNTSDANKPVSTATQTALNLKANLASPTFTGTVSGITKSMVGLSNADNTSDANKPISSATQTALDGKASSAAGVPSGGTTGQVLRKKTNTSYDTEWGTGGVTYGTTAGTACEGNDSRIATIRSNSITTSQGSNSGGSGGTITMRGGVTGLDGIGGNAGSINLQGSDNRSEGAYNGGTIDLSAGVGGGGNITSVGNNENAGGSITMSGGDGVGSVGGSINTSGGISGQQSASGGSINTSGGNNGAGGSINTSNNGGSINTAGGPNGVGGQINTSNGGGNINTNGYWNDGDQYGNVGGTINISGGEGGGGGSILMYGDQFDNGGSITTYDGGGSINTRGTGSIELGQSGTRTTLTGTATANRAISLPDLDGTLALTQQAGDYEVTDATKGYILKSPNNSRWRITIDNDGILSSTKL